MIPSIIDLFDELKRGRIYECRLRDPKWILDGLQDGDNIYIDPRPAILETLIHELIHRRHPRFSEKKVTTEARRLLLKMSEADKATWWRRYIKVRKMGRTVVEMGE